MKPMGRQTSAKGGCDNILIFLSETRQACSGFLSGIFRWANGCDWNVHVIEGPSRGDSVPKLLQFWSPTGCIVENGGSAPLEQRDFGRCPTVFIDSDPRLTLHHDVVRLDCASLGEQAAKALLSCHLAQYAYVDYRAPRFWCRERRDSFLAAIRLNGKEPLVFDLHSSGRSTRRTRKLQQWLAGLARPCGIFAANDGTAYEILKVCASIGIKVPDDVCLVGVDNDEQLCENVSPSLASFVVDRERAGFLAGRALSTRIACPNLPRQDILYPVIGLARRLSMCRAEGVPTDARARTALDAIHRRACEGIGPKDIVDEIGCSRRSVELCFRKAYGRSMGDEIRAVRLERACHLLMQTELQISEISSQCGYSSEDAIEKLFAAQYGCSPRQWRARERQRRFA